MPPIKVFEITFETILYHNVKGYSTVVDVIT